MDELPWRARLKARIEQLVADARAQAIRVYDARGQLIASTGEFGDVDPFALPELIYSNQPEGPLDFLWAPRTTRDGRSVSRALVGERALVCVLSDRRTTLGLVRLRVKQAAGELDELLAGASLDVITEADLERLFG